MNNSKWIKPRHRIITNVAKLVISPLTRCKYGVKVSKFKEADSRQFLILFNHQTAYDQFFLGMAFKNPIYYLATEDLFSMGFVSKLLTYAVAPIPIKKQTTDLNAVKTLISVAKEGGTIAIAPEGQRTFSGETTYINPAIVTMAKKLNLPIAIFLIKGGYGVQPRWSDVVRKGQMTAGVTRVIEPSEYNEMSKDDLVALINKEMYVNEACYSGEYKSPHLAEYLERTFYVCPTCGLTTYESHGDKLTCKGCGMIIRYLPNKEFEGINCEFPYKYVLDFYKAQEAYVNELMTTALTEKPVYSETVDYYEVIVYKRKKLLEKNVVINLYGDRIEIETSGDVIRYDFDEVKAVTILGKNKINIYHGKNIYQIKGNKRFNALKYINFYHRFKNIREEKNDVKFLGL